MYSENTEILLQTILHKSLQFSNGKKIFFFNFKYCNKKDLKAISLYVFSVKAFIFFMLNIYIIPVP